MSDTPASGPESSALDTNQAAALFAQILEPQPVEEPKKEETPEPVKDEGEKPAEPVQQEEAPAEPEKVTIEVDGKAVELTKAELAEAYKNGLRQADYTKKTMEVAEQRKAAEAEANKVREERQKLAEGLTQAQAVLQAQLQEQSNIDWHKLRETDPTEFLRQWHLYSDRQTKLQQNIGEQQQLHAKLQSEQAEQVKKFLSEQQEQLLAKLPEWKDEAKAKSEKAAIAGYLKSQGLEEAQISNITDHRVVVLSRKAMLYDQLMDKAKTASEKVGKAPAKVERPGGGETTNPLDGRTTAMKQLARTGKVEDAARVFAQFL